MKGYAILEKEFDECLRKIVQMGYGLVLISHSTDKTFTDQNGKEYNQIVPTLDKRARNICSRLCDIIGYSRAVTDENDEVSTKLFMRGTTRFIAGSRFKYTPDYIDFNYKSLVNAIGDAIDKQAEEDGQELFTTETSNLHINNSAVLNFDELIDEFNAIIQNIISEAEEDKFTTWWKPRIEQITDKYLGKGVKVNQCSREQVEAIDLILADLRELVNNNLNK